VVGSYMLKRPSVSDDLDGAAAAAGARAGVALLDPELSEQERTAAARRVRDAVATSDEPLTGDVEVAVFSDGLFVDGLLDAIRAEVPRLFGLALLVVLAILALMYRSLFDVLVGFLGLLATVVWTFGLVAALGPNNLAVTGPLTQLAVIVPVLLVGLGIDYSVHLTARYREQRAAGQPPAAAAGRALHTVGAALVLATAATAVGFASIATAPLGMLADFGVFVAIGVVCAFLVMGLLVPAARLLRDGRGAATAGATEAGAAAPVRELHLGDLLRWPSRLAVRWPWAGMVVAALLAAGSLVAATGLEVEFDRDDLIPEGSDVEAALADPAELFGGGVTESTFVVVDGDLTDVEVANAMLGAQADVGADDGVRSVGGSPQVVSAVSLAAAAARGLPAEAGSIWDGDGFASGADLGRLFGRLRAEVGEARLGQLLAPDDRAAVVQIRTTVGDAGAERLEREVEAAFAPVADTGAQVTVTSEPIIIAEMSEDLSAFQARAIASTLLVVLVLLAGYYTATRRRPLLGLIALVPATVSASLVVGSMRLLGISFNVLTATLTAIAVGIGVPYGVHVVNRFVEDLADHDADQAIARTLRSTGGALTGSALTTLGAFVVLAFSGLPPIRSLGLLGGAGIAFALLAAVLVEPGALTLWARRHQGVESDRRAAPRTTVTA
jgi:uncharacterized protein